MESLSPLEIKYEAFLLLKGNVGVLALSQASGITVTTLVVQKGRSQGFRTEWDNLVRQIQSPGLALSRAPAIPGFLPLKAIVTECLESRTRPHLTRW